MAIPLLKNTEAFLLILQVILRMFTQTNRVKLFLFAKSFCDLQNEDITPFFLKQVTDLFKKNSHYLHNKRYLKINIRCSPASCKETALNHVQKVSRSSSKSNSQKSTSSRQSRSAKAGYAKVLARSVAKLRQQRLHHIRGSVKPDALYLANKYFLQRLLKKRPTMSDTFLIHIHGGIWPQWTILSPHEQTQLYIPLMQNNKNSYFRITLRRLVNRRQIGICPRVQLLGSFRIPTACIDISTGMDFQLVCSLHDKYIKIDELSIQNASAVASTSPAGETSESIGGSVISPNNNHVFGEELEDDTSVAYPTTSRSTTNVDTERIVRALRDHLVERQYRPSFITHLQWCAQTPFKEFNRRDITSTYLDSIYAHVKLLKFVLLRKLRSSQILQHGEILERLLDAPRLASYLGFQLRLLLEEHAFQCLLNAEDRAYCVRVVVDDVRLLREEFQKPAQVQESYNGLREFEIPEINPYSSEEFIKLDKFSESNEANLQSSDDQKHLNESSQDKPLLTYTSSRLTSSEEWLGETNDIRPLEKLAHTRLLQWRLVGGGWAERRLHRLQPFHGPSLRKMFLDDFDLSSSSVSVFVVPSYGKTYHFVRFNTKKSLGLFTFENPLRMILIHLTSNRFYRYFLCLCAFLQFWTSQSKITIYKGFYVQFLISVFLADFIFQVIARGLFLHSFSYFRNTANILETLITFVQLIFNKQNSDYFVNDINSNIIVASSLLRLLRIIREMRSLSLLRPFRVFLQILASLLPQILPLVILLLYALLFFSELVIRLHPMLFRQLCVPTQRSSELFNFIHLQLQNDTNYADSFERLETAYTRINYGHIFYLNSYKPCGKFRENYLSDECPLYESCMEMSPAHQFSVGRLPPEVLSFENFYSTFLLQAMGMFNQNFDMYFYRMIRHGGFLSFIVGLTVYIFGFLMFSLVLAMIYDTYQSKMDIRRIFSPDTHYYYQGESEFTFDANQTPVCLKSQLLSVKERKQILKAHQISQNDQPCMAQVLNLTNPKYIQMAKAEEENLKLQFLEQNHFKTCSTISKKLALADLQQLSDQSLDYRKQCIFLNCEHFDRKAQNLDFFEKKLNKLYLGLGLQSCGPDTLFEPQPTQPYDALHLQNVQLVRRSVNARLLPDIMLKGNNDSKKVSTNKRTKKVTGFTNTQLDKVFIKDSSGQANSLSKKQENLSNQFEQLMATGIKFVSQQKIGKIHMFFYLIWNIIDEALLRFAHNPFFTLTMNFLAFFKLLLFVLYTQGHTLIPEEEIPYLQNVFETITPIISYVYIGELFLRLLTHQSWLTTAIITDIITLILDFTLSWTIDIKLHLFTNIRIWRIFVNNWGFLQQITEAIVASKLELTTNLILFIIVFTLFVLYARNFLDLLQVESEMEDYLRMEMDFINLYRTLKTVYLVIVSFCWQEITTQYLLFNDPEGKTPLFNQNMKKNLIPYEDKLPYALTIFVITSILYSLFFRNLFIPQIFQYLDLNKVIDILPKSKLISKNKKNFESLNENQNIPQSCWNNCFNFYIMKKVNSLLLKPLFNGISVKSTFLIYLENQLNSKITFLNWCIILILITSKPISVDPWENYIFLFSLLVNTLIFIEYLFRLMRKGILEFFLGYKIQNRSWRIFASSVDTISILFTYVVIIKQHQFGHYFFPSQAFYRPLALLSVWRMIRLSHYAKTWVKSFFLQSYGFIQCGAVCTLVIISLALLGTCWFPQKMDYCYIIHLGWFYQKSKRIALSHPYNPILCRQEPMVSDHFLLHQLSQLHLKASDIYNFDNLFNACATVIHLMFGSNIFATIEMLTSLPYDDSSAKQIDYLSWPYIVIVTVSGLILDAFVFSVIAKQMSSKSSFSSRSIYSQIQDKKMLGTYLVLENIAYTLPWQRPLQSASFGRKFMHRLVNNHLYNNMQFLLLLGNLELLMSQNYIKDSTNDSIEHVLLLAYILDGLARFYAVGSRLLRYPLLVAGDLVAPLIAYSLYISGIGIGTKMRWSLLITLRIFLAPDRYFTPRLTRAPRMLLRTLSQSARQAASMFGLLFGCLLFAAAVGISWFYYIDYVADRFEPPELPGTFNSLFFTLAHLASVTFSNTYDQSTFMLYTRQTICSRYDPELHTHLGTDALISRAVDENINAFYAINEEAKDIQKHLFPNPINFPESTGYNQFLISKYTKFSNLKKENFSNFSQSHLMENYNNSRNEYSEQETVNNSILEISKFTNISRSFLDLWNAKSKSILDSEYSQSNILKQSQLDIINKNKNLLFFCLLHEKTITIHFTEKLYKVLQQIQKRCIGSHLQKHLNIEYYDLRLCELLPSSKLYSLQPIRLNELFIRLLHQRRTILQLNSNNSISILEAAFNLCSYKKILALDSRDKFRLKSRNLLDQLVSRYLYSQIRFVQYERSLQFNHLANVRQIMQNRCSSKPQIIFYYLCIFFLCRLIVLNTLRALILSRYSIEQLRENNGFLLQDIQEFLSAWRIYCSQLRHQIRVNQFHINELNTKEPPTDPAAAKAFKIAIKKAKNKSLSMFNKQMMNSFQQNVTDSEEENEGMGEKITRLTHKFKIYTEKDEMISLYLPICYALLFMKEMAPSKFKMPPCSEESVLCIFGRYALRLREEDMSVHAIDLLAVCVANRLGCTPSIFQRDYQYVIRALAHFIYRECEDYEFDQSKLITMPTYLNGFFFGKLVLHSVMQRQVLGRFILDESEENVETKNDTNLERNLKKSN